MKQRHIQDADQIHVPEDGRGPREIYVDGKLIPHVGFADTKRGVVEAAIIPTRTDKYGKRILTRIFRGKVEVIFR